MFPHSTTKFNFPQYKINTNNFNIACEMLADLCVPFLVNDNGQIVFPTAASAKVEETIIMKTTKPAVVIEKPMITPIGNIEYLETLKARALTLAKNIAPLPKPIMPPKATKTPVFAIYGAPTSKSTIKELSAFLSTNNANLSNEKKTWYNEILKQLILEVKKKTADRLYIDEIIDNIEATKESTCRVTWAKKELKDGMCSMLLLFSETIVNPETKNPVKSILLETKIYAKPVTRPEREHNQKWIENIDSVVEKYQQYINKGDIKLYK
jgi:hypothetical protein